MKNVLKMLVVVSIFLSSMAFPVLSFAVLQEDQANLQPNQQVKQSNHIPGEVIIKFKDEAIIGAVAPELVRRWQTFKEITENSRDYKRYGVKSFDGKGNAGRVP